MEEPSRLILIDALKHKKDPTLHEKAVWNSLMGCWLVQWCGMTLGIETDGHIHT